jgi:hypothetical protein
MTITTGDELLAALGNSATRFVFDKANLSNQVAGRYASLWRATGVPGQAAIPTTAAVPTSATTGAIPFANQTAPATSYLARLSAASANNAGMLEIHDRLAHIGGFVLNSTTSQTVTGFDLDTLAPSAERLGPTDGSGLAWWLEVYTDGGATASNATINVTFYDTTSANLNVQAVGGTIRAGQCFGLNALIATGDQGKRIRQINSVILSASTGTAGNFGFTVTRPKASLTMPIANFGNVADWAGLGLPEIPNDSCLAFMVLPTLTSSGQVRGSGAIAHG